VVGWLRLSSGLLLVVRLLYLVHSVNGGVVYIAVDRTPSSFTSCNSAAMPYASDASRKVGLALLHRLLLVVAASAAAAAAAATAAAAANGIVVVVAWSPDGRARHDG
jgi:hypothetical protein